MTISEVVGKEIRHHRRLTDMTQADVAVKVGLSRASISNVERGRHNVSLAHLYAIADALGLRLIFSFEPADKEKK